MTPRKAHQITIDTMPKNNRRKDPPRSRWSCSCGAGDSKLTTPDIANAAAAAHMRTTGDSCPSCDSMPCVCGDRS